MAQVKKYKPTGSKIARKTAARLFAVQAVYQSLLVNVPAISLKDDFLKHYVGMDLEGEDNLNPQHEMVTPDGILFESILAGVTERKDDLARMIAPKLSGAVMEPLLTAILLCGTYELLAHLDVDAPIIITDYLHVTHGFYEGAENKLINGVLDRLCKDLRF
jgi:transcription antitermination protein NusB